MFQVILRKALADDIEKIRDNIRKFLLDYEDLTPEQLIIAEVDGVIAGFGRIKCYETVYELATIGVLEEYRKKGVGEKIIKYLIDISPSDELWITTNIPDYFAKFGFKIIDNPPIEIKLKKERICSNLRCSSKGSEYMVLKKTLPISLD